MVGKYVHFFLVILGYPKFTSIVPNEELKLDKELKLLSMIYI